METLIVERPHVEQGFWLWWVVATAAGWAVGWAIGGASGETMGGGVSGSVGGSIAGVLNGWFYGGTSHLLIGGL